MTTTGAAKPLLELTTLDPLERPFITIDGMRCELATPADFGIVALARLDQQAAVVDEMRARNADGSATALSDGDAAELSTALQVVVGQILRAPEAVLDSLTDIQRLAVLQAFTTGSTTAPAPNRKARRRRSTGARSSLGSRASTAPSTG